MSVVGSLALARTGALATKKNRIFFLFYNLLSSHERKGNKNFETASHYYKKKKRVDVLFLAQQNTRTGLAWNKAAWLLATVAQRHPNIERAVTRVILIAVIVMEMDLFVITSPKSGASDGVCHWMWMGSLIFVHVCVCVLDFFFQVEFTVTPPYYVLSVYMTLYTGGYSKSIGRLHNKCADHNEIAQITTHTYLKI